MADVYIVTVVNGNTVKTLATKQQAVNALRDPVAHVQYEETGIIFSIIKSSPTDVLLVSTFTSAARPRTIVLSDEFYARVEAVLGKLG